VSPDTTVVFVRGDIDQATAGQLRAALVRALQRRGGVLLVDLGLSLPAD
jgi:anti-anti-sigma regulatory factor